MKTYFFQIYFGFSLLCFSQQNVQPFLEDIVVQFPSVRDIAISHSGDEAYFSAQSVMGNVSAIIGVTKTNGIWGSPTVVSFSGHYFDIEPFLSPDGLTLYFASNRPLDPISKIVKDFDIWYVKRTHTSQPWSSPIHMDSPVNSSKDEFYPSVTTNNNLYFTCDDPNLSRKDDLYVCEFKNGKYSPPKPLSDHINSEGYEFNAFVAPDESFIIFTGYNKTDGFGSGDLYISYKTSEGWTEAKNLGSNINSDKMEYCPFVDFQSKILYFTSRRDNSTTNFDSPKILEELLQEFNRYDNGSSRLYQVSIDSLLAEKL